MQAGYQHRTAGIFANSGGQRLSGNASLGSSADSTKDLWKPGVYTRADRVYKLL